MLLETRRATRCSSTPGARRSAEALDIGRRVLAPALWARGIRSLDALLVTHGDPDHLGGRSGGRRRLQAATDLGGRPVPQHRADAGVARDEAARRRIPIAPLRAGRGSCARTTSSCASSIRREPDWERRRVRNDDSVVLEVVYGDVAIASHRRHQRRRSSASIVPRLTPARIRILKVAHHGSRTSIVAGAARGWRPQLARDQLRPRQPLRSPGAAECCERLEAIGAAVLRPIAMGRSRSRPTVVRRRWTFGGSRRSCHEAGGRTER